MTVYQRETLERLENILARGERLEGLLQELLRCAELNMDDMEPDTRELLKRITNVLKQPH